MGEESIDGEVDRYKESGGMRIEWGVGDDGMTLILIWSAWHIPRIFESG